MNQAATSAKKPENPLLSIFINIVIPFLVFDKLSDADRLGPFFAMLLGLSFPLVYGIWDFVKNDRRNWLSALGVVRLLLVGTLAVAGADGFWFAVGEASFPALIAVFIIISMRGDNPIVKSLLYNENLLAIDRIEQRLTLYNKRPAFQKIMVQVNWLLVASFVVSAVLNFVLARIILKSPAGTTEFTKEYGKMTALSWPVIVVPSMIFMVLALWRMFAGLKQLTGLQTEDIFKAPPPKNKEAH